MGKKASEVQREIEGLRTETGLLIGELESRLRETTNVKAQVRRHPVIAIGAGLSLLGGLAFAGYAVYERFRTGTRPASLLNRTAPGKNGGREERAVFRADTTMGSDNGVLKRVLYAAMTAAAVTLASLLARRMVDAFWAKTMAERPPKQGR